MNFLDACETGDLQLVSNHEWMSHQCPYSWNLGLGRACYGGQRAVVDFLISKGANHWDDGLLCACYGEHRELIELMLSKGANNLNNLNKCLNDACYRKNRKVIELMISKGANGWNSALYYACQHVYDDTHYDIIVLMLVKGAIVYQPLTDNSIQLQKLVEDHGLPVRKLQSIDDNEYGRVKRKYKKIESALTCVTCITNLSCLVTRYLIC